jgi:hypothetical protein
MEGGRGLIGIILPLQDRAHNHQSQKNRVCGKQSEQKINIEGDIGSGKKRANTYGSKETEGTTEGGDMITCARKAEAEEQNIEKEQKKRPREQPNYGAGASAGACCCCGADCGCGCCWCCCT